MMYAPIEFQEECNSTISNIRTLHPLAYACLQMAEGVYFLTYYLSVSANVCLEEKKCDLLDKPTYWKSLSVLSEKFSLYRPMYSPSYRMSLAVHYRARLNCWFRRTCFHWVHWGSKLFHLARPFLDASP